MKSFRPISKGLFYFLLLPGVMVVFGWQGWLLWNWLISPPSLSQSDSTEDTIQIQIPAGTTGQQLGEDLEAAGIIRSATAWRAWIYLQKFRQPTGDFKAGTYKLSVGQPLPSIAQKIWNGEVMQLSFTIPEGWTIKQMGDYFESVGYFSAEEFVEATKNIPTEQYPWLPEDLPHLEGFLMPDTYQLASDRVSPQQIIGVMLDQFESTALPVYEAQESQTDLSLLEWVTLASIVEKESVVDEERGTIAGVFTKRLDIGMALQADPTVEYGLGIRQTADQPLTYAQVETPSPYNTYVNVGLPPTPIAAPGLDSLKATLNPEPTDALYFVARYDGTHIFSETLAAHEAATRAIRRQREARGN
jgi:UPF0755 protein